MFSQKLITNDININKCDLKRRLKIIIPIIILLLVIIIVIIVVSRPKKEDEPKENKSEEIEKEEYIENITQYLIADFKLNENNQIINLGQSNTSKITNYQ